MKAMHENLHPLDSIFEILLLTYMTSPRKSTHGFFRSPIGLVLNLKN